MEKAVLGATRFDRLRRGIEGTEAGDRFLAGGGRSWPPTATTAAGEVEAANPRWSETPDEVLAQLRGCLRAGPEADLIARFEGLGPRPAPPPRASPEPAGPIRRAGLRPDPPPRAPHAPPPGEHEERAGPGIRDPPAAPPRAGGPPVGGGAWSARGTFFLTVDEVRALVRGELEGPAARPLAAGRRAEHAAQEALPAPPTIVGRPGGRRRSARTEEFAEGQILAGHRRASRAWCAGRPG